MLGWQETAAAAPQAPSTFRRFFEAVGRKLAHSPSGNKARVLFVAPDSNERALVDLGLCSVSFPREELSASCTVRARAPLYECLTRGQPLTPAIRARARLSVQGDKQALEAFASGLARAASL